MNPSFTDEPQHGIPQIEERVVVENNGLTGLISSPDDGGGLSAACAGDLGNWKTVSVHDSDDEMPSRGSSSQHERKEWVCGEPPSPHPTVTTVSSSSADSSGVLPLRQEVEDCSSSTACGDKQEPPLMTADIADLLEASSAAMEVAQESCLQVAFCEQTAQEMQAILKSYSNNNHDSGSDNSFRKRKVNALEWMDASDDESEDEECAMSDSDDLHTQVQSQSRDVDLLCQATSKMALATGSVPPLPFTRGGSAPSKDRLAVTQPWWWKSFGEEAELPPFSSSCVEDLHMQVRSQTSDVDRICSAVDTLIRAASSVETEAWMIEDAFAAAEAMASVAPAAAAAAVAEAEAVAEERAVEEAEADPLATSSRGTRRRRHRRRTTRIRARGKDTHTQRETNKESGRSKHRQRKKKTKKVSHPPHKVPKTDVALTQEGRLHLWMH